jgi:hypothetical protein
MQTCWSCLGLIRSSKSNQNASLKSINLSLKDNKRQKMRETSLALRLHKKRDNIMQVGICGGGGVTMQNKINEKYICLAHSSAAVAFQIIRFSKIN